MGHGNACGSTAKSGTAAIAIRPGASSGSPLNKDSDAARAQRWAVILSSSQRRVVFPVHHLGASHRCIPLPSGSAPGRSSIWSCFRPRPGRTTDMDKSLRTVSFRMGERRSDRQPGNAPRHDDGTALTTSPWDLLVEEPVSDRDLLRLPPGDSRLSDPLPVGPAARTSSDRLSQSDRAVHNDGLGPMAAPPQESYIVTRPAGYHSRAVRFQADPRFALYDQAGDPPASLNLMSKRTGKLGPDQDSGE